LIVLSSLPVKGFLGTGATFEADFNLVVQLAMAAALVAGVFLETRTLQSTRYLSDDGAAPELGDDRIGDVARVQTAGDSKIAQRAA
jgi:hypothetical protein